jgi:hypothetical protein
MRMILSSTAMRRRVPRGALVAAGGHRNPAERRRSLGGDIILTRRRQITNLAVSPDDTLELRRSEIGSGPKLPRI